MDLWAKNLEYYRREPFRPGLKTSVIVLIAAYSIALFVIGFFYIQFSMEITRLGREFIDKEVEKPDSVYSKGIYLTSWTAGGQEMAGIIDLINKTELNTVVIDIKDYTGKVAFDTDIKLVNDLDLEEIRIRDFRGLVQRLHEENIYVIARISVFQDPELAEKRQDLALKNKYTGAIWRDNRGLGWMDPASREVWNYIVLLAQEAADYGVDEVNFDYIRFPSDGNLAVISYPFWDEKTPKHAVVRNFHRYLRSRMRSYPVYLSVDLFGLTLVKTAEDDLNIGQLLEDALPYYDYIAPMTYPSHYESGFEGIKKPAEHPYEVISISLRRAKEHYGDEVTGKIRPWLQNFDVGAIYTPEMIQKQKQAVYDEGAYGWVLWNSLNRYTDEALEKE